MMKNGFLQRSGLLLLLFIALLLVGCDEIENTSETQTTHITETTETTETTITTTTATTASIDLSDVPIYSNDDLSEELKAEMEEAWIRQKKGYFMPPMVYYGTHNGYVILFLDGQFTARDLRVGNEVFQYTSSFVIWAYKNNVFYELKEVYDNGDLRDCDLAIIAYQHRMKHPEIFKND